MVISHNSLACKFCGNTQYPQNFHCPKKEDLHSGFLEETADLVTFTEEIPNGKLYFLCSVWVNREKLCGNYEFPQNFHARKLD